MFHSIREYLDFFHDAKSAYAPLVYGEKPNVTFEGHWVAYLFLTPLLLFFSAELLRTLVTFHKSPLTSFFLIAFFLSIIFLIIIGYQATALGSKNKKTSLKQLTCFNLTRICGTLKIPFRTAWKVDKPFLESPTALLNHLASPVPPDVNSKSFRLMLGKSTGFMSSLWHSSSLAPDQNIFLNLDDACKNILALGGIGSGKTSAVMQPLLLQLLDQKCGGLIFDIKGDVKSSTMAFAKHTNRSINIIGAQHAKINLIAGLTPEIASSFLKSSLLLANQGHLDLFWIDTATELSRNVLRLLSFIPKYYSLNDLWAYIFDKDAASVLEEKLSAVQGKLSPKQKRLFAVYHQYKTNIFDNFDAKVQSGVKATLAQALSPFNHPDLTDAFCSSQSLDLDGILNGEVFLVDMPISTWGLGAKVVYTFIKLRFFNLMQKHQDARNRQLPVFFMYDEFQEIVSCNKDGLSDLNFWDKARSSKTIGIISAQSIASFFAAVPNRDYAYALLQNFRNKICLTSEDPLTIDYISQLTGQAKTKKKSVSTQSSTISEVRDAVLEAQVIRSLPPNAAIALLSINNRSSDDALHLFPIYFAQNDLT